MTSLQLSCQTLDMCKEPTLRDKSSTFTKGLLQLKGAVKLMVLSATEYPSPRAPFDAELLGMQSLQGQVQ